MMTERYIGISEACLGEAEVEAVAAVLHSGWISQGEKVAELEQAMGRDAGLHGVAVTNCTAGLHLALAALGIGEGDEVLIPGVTFVATVNAVLYTGARPVPVDCPPGCPHMDMADADRKVSTRTRAVIIMHYGGYGMDGAAWRAFADSRDLFLVEDAAHCPGLPGVGCCSHAAVFSFFANKNMTTAEGGLILTADAGLAALMRRLRGHGMSTTTLDRAKGHAFSYDVDRLGWNYRMDEIRAALGLAQWVGLPARNARRIALSAQYRRLLAGVPCLELPFSAQWPTVGHLMPVLLPYGADRSAVMAALRDDGVQTSIHYPMYHRFSWHRAVLGACSLSGTEDWCSRELTLPLHPALNDDDPAYVVQSLRNALAAQGF